MSKLDSERTFRVVLTISIDLPDELWEQSGKGRQR